MPNPSPSSVFILLSVSDICVVAETTSKVFGLVYLRTLPALVLSSFDIAPCAVGSSGTPLASVYVVW